MALTFPITQRARRFGYVIWPSSRDNDVQALLGSAETVELTFNGESIGPRRIDRKHRRISVGPRRTQAIPEVPNGEFRLAAHAPGHLRVDCP